MLQQGDEEGGKGGQRGFLSSVLGPLRGGERKVGKRT